MSFSVVMLNPALNKEFFSDRLFLECIKTKQFWSLQCDSISTLGVPGSIQSIKSLITGSIRFSPNLTMAHAYTVYCAIVVKSKAATAKLFLELENGKFGNCH